MMGGGEGGEGVELEHGADVIKVLVVRKWGCFVIVVFTGLWYEDGISHCDLCWECTLHSCGWTVDGI